MIRVKISYYFVKEQLVSSSKGFLDAFFVAFRDAVVGAQQLQDLRLCHVFTPWKVIATRWKNFTLRTKHGVIYVDYKEGRQCDVNAKVSLRL